MNRKALLVLIPLLSMLSLLATPAFATPATYPIIEARGWASVRAPEGCFSGCATFYVVIGLASGAVPAIPTDNLNGGYVMLVVQGHTFEWVIDQSSIKVKCNVLTLCATHYVLDDVTINPQLPTSSISPITVVVDLCKPYCVNAYGCSTLFIGQGHPVTPT